MAGCATRTQIVDTGCQWTRTIIASSKDTVETLRQVRAHDAARAERCQ